MSAGEVEAREAALRQWRLEHPDAPWGVDQDDAFRDGWRNDGLSVRWLPSVEEAYLAGRRLRARSLAKEAADDNA